jgi:hypothetical protein
MSLTEAMNRVGVNYSSSRSLVRVDSTDWYTLVHDEPDKVFLSISKTNIPEKYWHLKGFEQARNARVTYSAAFIPQENPAKKAEAWKVPSDVSSIWFPEKEVKPGTYFRGPDNNIIKPENYDVWMDLENLMIRITAPGKMAFIPYYDIREYAEGKSINHKNKKVPFVEVKELLRLTGIEQKNMALIFHANNYAISVPPWRQDGLGVIFDPDYEKKRGVPTKLIGGEFLNKASHIEGFYKIDLVPMNT